MLATAALGGFFVVAVALDVLGQTFFFAHLLKSPQHLLDRFATSGLDLDHIPVTSPFR